jgi:hypothetical protein
VFEGAPDALPLDELLVLVDDFVVECSSSEAPEVLIVQFEEELQAAFHDSVDYSNIRHGETFLTILRHLAPVIPSTSIISWFDLVLRPALREPRLATTPLNYAKDLIIQALKRYQDVYSDIIENYTERVAGFRKRLFEFYLLDAFNEGSEDDVMEWTSLDEEERGRRSRWKENLEDILVRYGQDNPEVVSCSLSLMPVLIQDPGPVYRDPCTFCKSIGQAPALYTPEHSFISAILFCCSSCAVEASTHAPSPLVHSP